MPEQNIELALRASRSPQVIRTQLNTQVIGMEIENYKRIYHGFNLTELSATTLGGIPAYRIVYSFIDQAGEPHNRMDVYMTKDDSMYFFRYDTAPALYCKYLPVILKMMNSLQIDKTYVDKAHDNHIENDEFSSD